jgi:hypothetical protein
MTHTHTHTHTIFWRCPCSTVQCLLSVPYQQLLPVHVEGETRLDLHPVTAKGNLLCIRSSHTAVMQAGDIRISLGCGLLQPDITPSPC